jgi:hypothetical protein
MSNVIEAPITPNGEALVQIAIERLRETYPNWNPNVASPEYRMFVAFAEIVAELMILAFDVPEAIIRFVGAIVYQEPIIAAAFAEGLVNVTSKDTVSHTIVAGTQVIVTPLSENVPPLGFEFFTDATIEPGRSELLGSGVGGSATLGIIRALEPGPESNITGSTEATFDELPSWVQSVDVVENPHGGSAEETIEAYTRRIVELARLIAPRPILPEDFANYVRLLTTKEQVLRAVAIDGMKLRVEGGHTKINASGEGEVEAEGAERCVTVIAMNTEGKHLGTAAREEAEAKLKAAREKTFETFVAGPAVHPITVKVVGKFFKGYSAAGVRAELEERLKALLNPATWGTPSTGDVTGWRNQITLRYQDIVTAVNSAAGFNYYTELLVNGGTADVALAGVAPVPEAGTMTIELTEGTE